MPQPTFSLPKRRQSERSSRPRTNPALGNGATPTSLVLQRALAEPHSLTPTQVLTLQRTIGNRATARMLGPLLQKKELTVGAADDPYEQEADRVAEQVVRQIDPAAPVTETAQRSSESSTAQEVSAVAHGPEGGEVAPGVQQKIAESQGSGKPLDADIQRQMEEGFGADFSGVRIHTGAQADTLNRSLNARAFTVGSDVYFRSGEYNVGSNSGKKLLAHELTHTLQQGSGPVSESRSSRPPTIQRLVSASTFKKKTSLFARKGKSHAFFSAIKEGLRAYQALPDNASPHEKLSLLDTMLGQVNEWLNGPDSANSSRRKYAERLQRELVGEIGQIEQTLQSVQQEDFNGDNGVFTGHTIGGGQMKKGLKELQFNFDIRQVEEEDRKVEGGTFTGFFAEETDEIENYKGQWPDIVRIPKQNPAFAKRSVATYKLDRLLGSNVIPPTFLAQHEGAQGWVMEKVNGDLGRDRLQNGEVMNNPLVRQGLSKLYLLDVITGQVDRNAGNYMIVVENGVIKGVRGIDNDLSFGEGYNYDTFERNKNYLFGNIAGKMPSQLNEIDRTFAERIIQVANQPALITDALTGLLTDAEINATIVRLNKLADFLRPLLQENDGRIVTEWR